MQPAPRGATSFSLWGSIHNPLSEGPRFGPSRLNPNADVMPPIEQGPPYVFIDSTPRGIGGVEFGVVVEKYRDQSSAVIRLAAIVPLSSMIKVTPSGAY